jgi:hypothetical protein
VNDEVTLRPRLSEVAEQVEHDWERVRDLGLSELLFRENEGGGRN